MKKRSLGFVGLLALLGIMITSCGQKVVEYDGTEVQGVSASEIVVGNTAATAGGFAVVGVPFNAAIEAVFADYNAAGGFGGAHVKLKHYNDDFDGAKGLTYTKKLVEEDKIFALVGHFGTNTVTQTVDYIKEKGVPMVYAATGVSSLYQEKAKGYNRAVMPVQPIFDAEGQVLLARAVAATEEDWGLGGTKVGVISTTDDAGTGMLAGIKKQAKEVKMSITYVTTAADQGTDHSAAVNKLKNAQCDVVIVAANQVPFTEILNYMKAAAYDAKVITSYVSANTKTLGDLVDNKVITKDRPVYTTAWLDITDVTRAVTHTAYYKVTVDPDNPADATKYQYTLAVPTDTVKTEINEKKNEYGFAVLANGDFYWVQVATAYSQDYWDYAECVARNGHPEYMANSYGMAGYIAGKIFVEGLKRVKAANKDLTWKNYIEAMEEKEVSLPMGGTLDYSDGNRFGVTSLALNTISLEKTSTGAYTLVAVDGIRTLKDVMDHIPTNLKK
ncbi:MAG: ABC transporter substrate-binding protein [Bacilli bacterium]|jgi:ABC-type branched-subunit amino acid transport system substrate-binding protein